MSAHTPGPWTLTGEAGDEPIASVMGPDGKLVVAGECDGWMVPFQCRGEEEGTANARLIAAAPDLLAVLKECLESEERRRRDLTDGSPASSYSDARLARVRDAIAKAEGKS